VTYEAQPFADIFPRLKGAAFDELVPEARFKAIFGVCHFTIWRWRRDDAEFPQPDYIRPSRNGRQALRYYTKRKVEAYRSRKFKPVAA
jgi:hypothetical protein